MKRLFPAILLIAASVSCSRSLPVLNPGNWNDDVYSKISNVIAQEGKASKAYNPECKPYAVFDFDNTSIINDCEISLMHYMIDNMSFKIQPEDMFTTITSCIPDIDKPVLGDCTVRMLAEDITDDYSALYGKPLEDITGLDAYKDLRAKLSALYFVTEDCYDYQVCCEWILTLFEGMETTEISDLAKASFDYYSSMPGVSSVTWTSPESGKAGTISATHLEGIHATDEMKDLYSTLKANGFDVYICSASLEAVVEAIACSEDSGFDMDPEFVYGLRPSEESYIQTYKSGKTGAIKAYMAPEHGGRGPSIVGGDSNGDYNMLTDFDDMGVGLIINCGNGGGIGRLAASGDPKYAVQGRDLESGTFVK